MSSLLDGVTVIECGIWIQGPYAAAVLGDLGADVIKVEPLRGDPMRGLADFTLVGSQKRIRETGRNYMYEFTNRNKRSIALNQDRRQRGYLQAQRKSGCFHSQLYVECSKTVGS